MKHVRTISKPLPQDAVVIGNLLNIILDILLNPINFILGWLGKNTM